MHKYIPTIWIINCSSATNLIDLFSHPASSFTFKETEFIAVTAYQVYIYYNNKNVNTNIKNVQVMANCFYLDYFKNRMILNYIHKCYMIQLF